MFFSNTLHTLLSPGLGLLLAILLIVTSPSTADPSAIHVAPIYSENDPPAPFGLLPFTTKTVYGFLDFITTVGNTVMVFTPQGEKGRSDAVVAPSPSLNVNIQSTTALGLESLFQNLDKTRDPAPFIEIQSSQQETASSRIKPTSVKTRNNIKNNRVKLQSQADDFIYDKFSTEPAPFVEETIRIKSDVNSPAFGFDTAPETIREGFFGGAGGGVFPTGVVTATDDTLIANGLTTIRSTEVFGTFLNGEYAQVVQSTAKVFQDGEEKEGGFAGSAQITDLSQFDTKDIGIDKNAITGVGKPNNPLKDKIKSRIKINNNRRTSAISSFKERLKNRYQKFRETAPGPSAERRNFSPSSSKPRNFDVTGETSDVVIINGAAQTTASSFRRKSSRLRERSRGRSLEPDTSDILEKVEEKTTPKPARKSGRSSGGFGSRQRTRTTRPRPSFNRKKDTFSRSKIAEVEKRNRGASKRFQNDRLNSRTQVVQPSSVDYIKPTVSSKFRPNRFASTSKVTDKPKIQIKKFNRFSRPSIRKDLLNKFLKNRPESENNVDPTKISKTVEDEKEDNDLSFGGDHDTSPSALVPSIVDDEEALQNLDIDDETRLKRLQTTLLVSTVYPSEATDEYLEIATIRSPYTFAIEDDLKSTRFITVTRTESKTIETTVAPSSTFIRPSSVVSNAPKGTPLFETDSIPAPENILATSTAQHYNEIIQGTQDIETLPAVTIGPQANGKLPPFKTVAETFSTEDVMVKRSILPIIQGSETSYYTLSQYYTVTRLVTALKTIPPMELYEFSPSKAFTDFDQLFEGAGSEKRYEQLLPGELEFSDQDDFERDGPTPIRVAPPPGFQEDLDLIGAKLDFVENMEKDNNPGIVQLKKQPSLQSSFNKPVPHLANFNEIKPTRTQATPFLPDSSLQPNGLLGTLGLTPEQLLYLQILQNPLAALGLGGASLGGEVITETKPIYRTETAYETDTIKLFYGASSFYSTLTRSVSMTTITDYEYATKTVGNALGRLPFAGNTQNKNVIDESPLAALPFGGFGIQPAVTVVTDTITKNTVVPSVFEESYRIRFRNEFVFTTITSTTMVSTQLTEYVTQTKRVSPF